MFVYHVETGPGVDAELGRTLFKIKNILVKGLINGYYFHMNKNTDLRGGGATIAIQPNTYLKITANGAYDNYLHTQATVGVQVSLFDLFSNDNKTINDQDLHRRLFEPVQRNFANIDSGGVTRTTGNPRDRLEGNTSPGNSNNNNNGQNYDILTWYQHHSPERSNIWFFNGVANAGLAGGELGATEDGTYEHPYTSFTQAELANASNYTKENNYAEAYLYFSKGMYNAINGNGPDGAVEVFSNESLWGRIGADDGFAEPATGNDRALFIGSLQLDSNSALDDVRVQNDSSHSFATGVILDNAQNVSISDTQIGTNAPDGSYKTGATMKNNSSLTISGSEIYGYSNGAYQSKTPGQNAGDAVGLKVQNGGDVTAINHSLIQGHSVHSYGIGLFGAPTTDIVGNEETRIGDISGDKTADFRGVGDSNAIGIGLYAGSSSALSATTSIGSITDSNFTGIGTNFAYGFDIGSSSTAGTATSEVGEISGSNFTGDSSTSYGGNIYSSSSSGTAITQINDITDSNFTGNASDYYGYGLYAYSGTKSGSALTDIGSISGSNFTADSSGYYTTAGLAVISNPVPTTYVPDSGKGRITIGSITDSNFTGTTVHSNGYGLYVESTSSSSSSSISMGDITGSHFTGAGINGMGAFIKSTAYGGASSITLNNITGSYFTGNGSGSDTYEGGYGMFIMSAADGSATASTTIGNISGSDFKGTNAHVTSYGLYVESYSTTGASNTTIGAVTGNTFSAATTSGVGINLIGGNINLNGLSDLTSIEKYVAENNYFSAPSIVCVNGKCL